jgi:hypothetical protein
LFTALIRFDIVRRALSPRQIRPCARALAY